MNTSTKMPINLFMMGKRICQLRRQKSLLQSQLAEDCGLSDAYISLIENGHKLPALISLIRIATALDTSIDYLLFGLYPHPLDASVSDGTSSSNAILRLLSDSTEPEQLLLLDFLHSAKLLLANYAHTIS